MTSTFHQSREGHLIFLLILIQIDAELNFEKNYVNFSKIIIIMYYNIDTEVEFQLPLKRFPNSSISLLIYGTEAEIHLPLKRSSRFQRLFPNPSWLV